MTLTVELPASVVQRIRERARAVGTDPETVVANLVREHFSPDDVPAFTALTEDETKWFKQVNEVPPPATRQRWSELDRLRKVGQLNDEQQAEMTRLYDQIEACHARRIAAAAELAKLWHAPFDSVISQLGLRPSDDDD